MATPSPAKAPALAEQPNTGLADPRPTYHLDASWDQRVQDMQVEMNPKPEQPMGDVEESQEKMA